MKSPDKFEDYLSRGVIKKQRADLSRKNFLIKTSEISKKDIDNRVKKEGFTDINANALIKECYDLIMQLIRAKMFSLGYSAYGEGAHEAEVSFLRKLNISEKDVVFLNYLRFIRNGISYYGRIFSKDDASEVFIFLNKLLPILRRSLE
jgi:hypothetical protein